MIIINDIARECGVSINIVSFVINNKKGELSLATRERIWDAMRRMNYRPNNFAWWIVGKSLKTNGVADRYLLENKQNNLTAWRYWYARHQADNPTTLTRTFVRAIMEQALTIGGRHAVALVVFRHEFLLCFGRATGAP